MSEPKISFVCPTYNRVEWLGECIQSLRAQTVKDIEIIIVDDGSTDGTDELLNWLIKEDARIKVIVQENKGAGMARNAGTAIASAPIIGVCDSDDVYTDERAAKTIEWMEKNPSFEMMNSPYVRVNYWNEVTEHFQGKPFDEKLFKELGVISFYCHPTAAYYKKDWEQVRYKSETKEMTDDRQFVEDWIKAGKHIGFLPYEPLCMHRVLPNSIMASMRGWKPEWVA